MTLNPAIFSSKNSEHETPQEWYGRLDARYGFTLDPCSTDKNHKTPEYYTAKENGLIQSWQGHRVFMNPPYGRGIDAWVKKALHEWDQGDCLIVGLLPARLDTQWFKKYIDNRPGIFWEVLEGRLTFEKDGKPCKYWCKKTGKWKTAVAPFPSVVVYWVGII